MSCDFDRVAKATKEDRESFKKTFAAQPYLKLFEIFSSAPQSQDRTDAIGHLTQAFNSHFELWLAMGS